MDAKVTDAANAAPVKTEDIEIRLLLEAIFRKYHYDFRGYAMASVKRRLIQARDHFNCHSISALQDLILHDSGMMMAMLPYLTVQVSELFRDPLYFKAVREKVVPHLKTYPSLKVWIAGCSTGEELYSFAILFREEGLFDRTLFYATDINHDALKKAEAGVYSLDRIKLFDKSLRKNVVFSDHSLATDAVFAETQMVSCRNVLIYFDRDLQDRAITLFRESLTRKGFLGLGSKETLRFSSSAEAFSDFVLDERLYQKRDVI
jgi:chemotaxis protein methyltransferase CheR